MRAEAGELAELAQALRTQLECARGLAAAAIAAQELSLQGECAARAQARGVLRNTAAPPYQQQLVFTPVRLPRHAQLAQTWQAALQGTAGQRRWGRL